MTKDKLNKILHKDNKTVGLTIVIVALVMLLSGALGVLWNPIYLIEYVTFVAILGEWGSLLAYIGIIIFAAYYYLDIKHEYITKRRAIAFTLLAVSIFMFFMTVFLVNNGVFGGSYVSIIDWCEWYVVGTYGEKLLNIGTTGGQVGITLENMGVILPLWFWFQGLLGLAEWIGFLIWIPAILYFSYVIFFNDWEIYWEKLNPFSDKGTVVKSDKKFDSIDLNEATEEFEMNFSQEEKEYIEVIEKVRSSMDTTSYDQLSKKIQSEKQKLMDLRSQVIQKVRENNEAVKKQRTIPSELRDDLISTLSYTSYTQARRKAEEQAAMSAKVQEELNSQTQVKEETKEENLTLLNDGYKTTEETLSLEESMLSDDFVNSLIDSNDPTMELPLIKDYYEDIFNHDEKLEDEINKTLESEIDLGDERTTEQEISEVSGEIIIEELVEDVTVEEYLSLPEKIEHSVEKAIDLQQVHAIADQKDNSPSETYESLGDDSGETSSTAELSLEEVVYEETEEEEIETGERPSDWCTPYVLPSTTILSQAAGGFDNQPLVEDATNKSKILNMAFESFGVKATVNSFDIGPTITTFKIELQPGVKTTKVTNIEDNLKMNLGVEYIRILAPIPGTIYVGIEIPNKVKKPVSFRDVYDNTPDGEGIMISIGQDVSGKAMSFDLTKAPHLLVAGSTGSGKSVAINTILASILLRYKPTDVQLVLVDPKMVEFAPFHSIPHLLSEVIIDANNANKALQAMVQEMEDRYKEMSMKGAKKIEELNEILVREGKAKKPYIVIIIDELADLMMVAAKEVEDSIMRITQKARAAGIHMVLATQRPSTEIITGTIKSNIPSRMAFTVASSIDSRTILGQVGAEKLIGMGDMLVSLYGKLPVRGQGAYISNSEVEDITAFTKSQCSAHYVIDVEKFAAAAEGNGGLIDTDDPLFIQAVDVVTSTRKASTSFLQRRLGIGYNKAANIIETMEAEGIIGPSRGSKPREVLILE